MGIEPPPERLEIAVVSEKELYKNPAGGGPVPVGSLEEALAGTTWRAEVGRFALVGFAAVGFSGLASQEIHVLRRIRPCSGKAWR